MATMRCGRDEITSEATKDQVIAPGLEGKQTPANASELLEMCRTLILRYIVLSEEQAVILAALVLHTHVFEAAEVTPYFHVTSPERECGKSHLIELLATIVRNPVTTQGTTAAALVRTIAAEKPTPTMLLDEIDAQFAGNKEAMASIRGILNAGFQEGGVFRKCAPNTFEIQTFNVYCPKVFGGIGNLPDTVASRCIRIEMRRKLPGEIVEPFFRREVRAASEPVRSALEDWAASDVEVRLRSIHPARIAGISDRQNDIAEPLLAIARLAGDGWSQRIMAALLAVFKSSSHVEPSEGVMLLEDIRGAFEEHGSDRLQSEALATFLNRVEGRPWADWNMGKGITPNNLARRLKRYRISSRKVRFGERTFQGYMREWFDDSWRQFCPPPTTGTVEQPASLLVKTAFLDRNATGTSANSNRNVPLAKSASNTHEQGSVPDVPVSTGGGAKGLSL
jgi:hypothetical protein